MPFTRQTGSVGTAVPTGSYVLTPRRSSRRGKNTSTATSMFFATAIAGPMTLEAAYDPTLSRVRLTGTDLPSGTASVTLVRYDTAVLTNADDVRGGAQDATPGDVVRVDDYEFTDAVVNTYRLQAFDAGGDLLGTAWATITPALSATWLKSLTRPFLNRTVTVAGFSDVTAPARGGVFDVLGRRLPVAVTEVRGSRRYELTLLAADVDEARAIETALAFGDVMYLQPPAGCAIPGPMHVFIGDVTTTRAAQKAVRRYLTLPLTEVAAPSASVVGATITWGGVMSAYPTWADVKAAKATWADLMQSISAPDDEVVG